MEGWKIFKNQKAGEDYTVLESRYFDVMLYLAIIQIIANLETFSGCS